MRRQSGARHTEDLLRLPARCGGGQDTLRPPSRYGPAQPPPRAQRRAPPRAVSAAVAARPRQSRIQSMPCRRIFAESRSGRGPVEAFPMPSCCSSIVLAAAGHFHVHRTLASEGRRGAASWCPASCRWGRALCCDVRGPAGMDLLSREGFSKLKATPRAKCEKTPTRRDRAEHMQATGTCVGIDSCQRVWYWHESKSTHFPIGVDVAAGGHIS